MSDPTIPSDQLARLADKVHTLDKKEGVALASNPNMPARGLVKCFPLYPSEVLQNPATTLIQMTDLTFFEALAKQTEYAGKLGKLKSALAVPFARSCETSLRALKRMKVDVSPSIVEAYIGAGYPQTLDGMYTLTELDVVERKHAHKLVEQLIDWARPGGKHSKSGFGIVQLCINRLLDDGIVTLEDAKALAPYSDRVDDYIQRVAEGLPGSPRKTHTVEDVDALFELLSHAEADYVWDDGDEDEMEEIIDNCLDNANIPSTSTLVGMIRYYMSENYYGNFCDGDTPGAKSSHRQGAREQRAQIYRYLTR